MKCLFNRFIVGLSRPILTDRPGAIPAVGEYSDRVIAIIASLGIDPAGSPA